MKTVLGIIGIAVVLLVGGQLLTDTLQSGDPDIVARRGLHWHPTLEIFVRGERVEIPESVGLGATHSPIHTHDDLPIIHLEFSGPVHTGDITLGKFFDVWGRNMDSFGTLTRMTVNGSESTQLGGYVMRDGDRIQLMYD